MSRIRIKYFGPIKEGSVDNDGWIDIKKVTVFIGDQGSGKSTIAKLISNFVWMEKALVRGDYDEKWFARKNRLKNTFLEYHRLENYLPVDDNKTLIEYDGLAYNIKYENKVLTVTQKEIDNYPLPQIMYVPAERNFIAYVKTAKELRLSSDSLQEFLTEFENAKSEIRGLLKLPINNTELEYDRLNDTLNLKGNDYKIKLVEASSGFQSLVPLFIVTDFLANSVKKRSENSESMNSEERQRFKKGVNEIYNNNELTDEQRRIALSALSAKFNKTSFVNIVEEPEQNLFPSSQWHMLQSLLAFNNMNVTNKLILTTHSPYLINYLTLAVKADMVKSNLNNETSKEKLAKIVPLESTVKTDDLVIYEMDEEIGIIHKLADYKGLPSDENELNIELEDANESFAQLQEIEKGWR